MTMWMLALAAAVLAQEEAQHEWAGFREGSRITRRITETLDGKQQATIERYTLMKIEGDEITLKHEMPGRTRDRKERLVPEGGFRRVGAEDVEIDGKTFSCGVYERVTEESGAKTTRRQWMSRDVPGRVARVEIVIAKAGLETRAAGRITKLDQRLAVGGKSVRCAILELEGTEPDGSVESATHWISEDVPGFTVKKESRRRARSGKELARIVELIEFDAR